MIDLLSLESEILKISHHSLLGMHRHRSHRHRRRKSGRKEEHPKKHLEVNFRLSDDRFTSYNYDNNSNDNSYDENRYKNEFIILPANSSSSTTRDKNSTTSTAIKKTTTVLRASSTTTTTHRHHFQNEQQQRNSQFLPQLEQPIHFGLNSLKKSPILKKKDKNWWLKNRSEAMFPQTQNLREYILRDEELVEEKNDNNNNTSVENVYGGSDKGTQVSSGGSTVASQNVSEVKVNYCNDYGDVIKTNWELRECDEAGYSKILRRGKEKKDLEEQRGGEIYGERNELF